MTTPLYDTFEQVMTDVEEMTKDPSCRAESHGLHLNTDFMALTAAIRGTTPRLSAILTGQGWS